jgi:hypothetical protein
VRFLPLEGLDPDRIHHELKAVLGRDEMPYSRVIPAFRSAIWIQTDWKTPHSEIGDAIVQALGQVLFASVKDFGEGGAGCQLLYVAT